MAFILIKTNYKFSLVDSIFEEKEQTFYKQNNIIIKYTTNSEFHNIDDSTLVFEGRILYDNYSNTESKTQFINDLTKLSWPLPNTISGYFSGFLVNGDDTYIFTDPIGINNLFYYHDENMIIISSSISAIQKIKKFKLDYAGLVLETCNHYSQFGKMTVLEGVKRLMPGEIIQLSAFCVTKNLFDYSIKNRDEKPEPDFHINLVNLINDESKKLFKNENVVITLSGGIDSRINLAPLIVNENNFEAINYGSIDLIDSKIPSKIAEKFKFRISFFNPNENAIASLVNIDRFIEKTDSLYVNMWHSILLENTLDEKKVFLLGDMLDILRAKSIASLKTRKFRTRFYIKKFFSGSKLSLNRIDIENLKDFQENKTNQIIKNVKSSFKLFKFNNDTKETIIINVKKQLEQTFNHLNNYNCLYIESYEELFGIFTSGRLTMGKQLNLLRFKYRTEIPLTNIKILRKVLNIAPNFRYSDELTSKMFKVKKWEKLGNFPTAQNPFFSYNSFYYLMLLGWFLRSKIDYYLTKLYIITKGKSKKTRLFKTLNHQEIYTYENAYSNFISYFPENEFCNFQEKIDLFKRRKDKISWPLASQDLMPFAQVMYYVRKFHK